MRSPLVVSWPIRLRALVGLGLSSVLSVSPVGARDLQAPFRLAQNDDIDSGARGQVTLDQSLQTKTHEPSRTVIVKGAGSSSDEARRDAARQAIQQVAGLYIDARRQIESKISDQVVSDVVHEKILSYSNAYISKLDVLNASKQADGLMVVEAKVSVVVAPLIKVLQENKVPTVAFDTNTAVGQVDAASKEKQGAIDIYADLVGRSANLMSLDVGTPRVNSSLPAPVDKSWLTIPVTYVANGEAIKDWRAKFERIAAKHMTVDVPVVSKTINARSTQPCSVPVFDAHSQLNDIAREDSFLGQHIPFDQEGITVCFADGRGSSSVTFNCFGRTFMKDAKPSPEICQGPECLSFNEHSKRLGMRFELLDASGSVVDSVPIHFNSFPMLNMEGSTPQPPSGASGFFNFCAPTQSPFYTVDPYFSAYGNVIALPQPGERLHAYGNFLLPNDVISRTASLRARIVDN